MPKTSIPKKHKTETNSLSGRGGYCVQARCSCGWKGEEHFSASAGLTAGVEAIQHETEDDQPREVEKTLELLVSTLAELMNKVHRGY